MILNKIFMEKHYKKKKIFIHKRNKIRNNTIQLNNSKLLLGKNFSYWESKNNKSITRKKKLGVKENVSNVKITLIAV